MYFHILGLQWEKRLKPTISYTFWQSVIWPWEYDSKPTEIKSSFTPLVTFVLMLFSYSSNTSESKNTRQNLQFLFRKVLPVPFCYFQATYHHVQQTWSWRILSAADYFILKKELTVPKSLAEVHGDCQLFKQNWDKNKPRHFKYRYYKCALNSIANWIRVSLTTFKLQSWLCS